MNSPAKRISTYLDQVCAQVSCREMHDEIRAELSDHLQAMLDEAVDETTTQEVAVEQVLQRMGDPDEVGARLNQAHQPRTDWTMLALVGCFVAFGLVATYVLKAQLAMTRGELLWELMLPKLAWVGLGCAVAGWFFRQDYRRLQRYSWHLFGGTLACMLWALYTDIRINGQPQFVFIGGMTISIYAIAPYLLIIALAGILPRWEWKQPLSYLKLAPLLLGPVLVFLVAPSFAGIMVYTLGFMAVSWVSGLRWSVVFGLPASLGLATIMAVTGKSLLRYLIEDKGLGNYRLQRLLIWLNPSRDPQGMGYLPLKINQAIRSAGWGGRGVDSLTEIGLPMGAELAVTSMIHAFGIFVGLSVALLAMGFVYRMVKLAKGIREPYGRALVIGLSALFSCQLILNLLMNGIMGVSLAPLLSVNIPFLAMSGSLFNVEMAAVGLMLATYRRKDMIPRAKV